VYLNHWTARGNGGTLQTQPKRIEASQYLLLDVQEQVRTPGGDPGALILAAGDFNDEPFDTSLTDPTETGSRMYISRDRTPVIRRDPGARYPLLYNPSWRLLGDVWTRSEELAADHHAPAATYLYGDVEESRWGLYDQVLVSGGMIAGATPVFAEHTLRIHFNRDMVSGNGTSAHTSDHFPLTFTLDFG